MAREKTRVHPPVETSKKSRETSPLAEAYTRVVVKGRVLERLLHLFSDLSRRDVILDEILNAALDAIPSEGASFVAVDPETGEMTFEAARGPVGARLKGLTLSKGTGLVGACADSKRTIAVSDVRRDKRHAAEIDARLGFETRSLIAVAVIHKGEVRGVIELVNREGTDIFLRHDIELLERVSRAAGSLIALMGSLHAGHRQDPD